MRELVGYGLELLLCLFIALSGAGVTRDGGIGYRPRRTNKSGIGSHCLSHRCACLVILVAAPVAINSAGQYQYQHDNAQQRQLLPMLLRLRNRAARNFLKLVFLQLMTGITLHERSFVAGLSAKEGKPLMAK